MQDIFFALDIGTRSVIGLIGRPTEDGLVEILDMEVAEHSKRAMIDGQIEDIAQVAKVILSVKTALEERIGFKLTKVNVAAAGRALKTLKSEATLELNHESVIDQVKISELESKAISQANKNLEETLKSQRNNFLCVGYSVMRYYLDDYEISTLIGHKGDNCKVEMIVTFLPSEVIESLYAVMAMVDLQVQSMTLEPIAAMNAVIPKELRSLNLAL
ncbi:MAG: cell division protein FtsA, partial [Oscillospiraceae bacterium]